MITKAIIPVAGWGTRRLPITKIIEKSMLPVGNRPLLGAGINKSRCKRHLHGNF